MIIDLRQITNKPYLIDEIVEFPTSYYENTDIRLLKDIKVNGTIELNYEQNIEYNLNISGIMVLPNSFTLEDYEYKFATNVNEIVDESDIFYDKLKNTLDIMEILWQNIVLEVPIQVGDSNKEPIKSGEGWELVSEDTKKIDPRLAPLQELLKDKKEVENK